MNRIGITGNICNDLELKTNGDTKILNFTVAVRRKFKDKEGNVITDFLRCVAFNNQAEFINKYFKKGSPILVEGSLQTNNYETPSGEKRTSFNIVTENVDFFSRKNETENNNIEQVIQQSGVEFQVSDTDDDLPF